MIEFDNVSKVYPGDALAVDDISLVCPTGQITVFVGPSGCGKTTSLRMINRAIEPTSGRITLNGVDVRDPRLTELRRGIGYVIQSAGLFPHRTILDNITTVPRLLKTSKRAARTRAGELMELVGLAPSLASRYPYQLSGGQQQRVGVARALAADPPVLLMDEPFAAVDPVVRHELQQELLRIQREVSKTIVFVTHDIDEATLLGDAVAVFKAGGRLAQFGAPGELISTPQDAFVEGFLGAGRGLRSLQFVGLDGLALSSWPQVPRGASSREALELARREGADWLVVLDDAGRPTGCVRADDLAGGNGSPVDSRADSSGSLDLASLQRVESVERGSADLRQALDKAILSPAQRVAVCEQGRLVGSLSLADLTAAIPQPERTPRGD